MRLVFRWMRLQYPFPKVLAMRAFRWKQALAIACCFGLFQGIMSAIGYVVGLQFSQMIQKLGPLDCLCFTCAYWCEYDS